MLLPDQTSGRHRIRIYDAVELLSREITKLHRSFLERQAFVIGAVGYF